MIPVMEQMEVGTGDLITIIGTKEVELWVMRRRTSQMQQQIMLNQMAVQMQPQSHLQPQEAQTAQEAMSDLAASVEPKVRRRRTRRQVDAQPPLDGQLPQETSDAASDVDGVASDETSHDTSYDTSHAMAASTEMAQPERQSQAALAYAQPEPGATEAADDSVYEAVREPEATNGRRRRG